MSVKQFSRNKDGDKQVSENFKVREFASGCGSDVVLLDERLPKVLQTIRELLGNKSISVSSGYRTPDHNARIGGAKNSNHMRGMAADLQQKGTDQETMCRAAETALAKHKIPGSIIKYPTFVHVDTSPTRYRGVNDGKTLTRCNGWSQMAAAPIQEEPKVAGYQVQIVTETDPLNVRNKPHNNSEKIGAVAKESIQIIVKESTGAGANLWGQLPSGGWISLDFVRKI